MSPLRILFVATEWSSGHGGVSTFNRELACAVARVPNVEVWCALPRHPSEHDLHEATSAAVHLVWPQDCPAPPDNDLFLLAGPMTDVSKADGDVLPGIGFAAIVGHGRWTGPAAFQLARRHKVPIRVQVVHVDPRRIEPLKVRTESSGNRVDALSALERALVVSPRELVAHPSVIAFGVGPRLTEYLRDREHALAEELLPGLSEQPFPNPGGALHVLFVGRLEDGRLKGLDLALRELHEVACHSRQRIDLELRGSTDEIESQEVVDAQLAALQRSSYEGLQARVSPFTVDSVHLDASFRNASLVLMPSLEEGFGLVGLEAIARGRPVVMSRYSGLADLVTRVTHDPTPNPVRVGEQTVELRDSEIREAFIFDPGDRGDLARKVEGVFSDLHRARARALRLRELLVLAGCDWDKTAHAFVQRIRDAGSAGDLGPPPILAGPPEDPHGTIVAVSPSVHRPSTVPGTEASPTHGAVEERPRSGLAAWPRDIAGRWIERPERQRLRDEAAKDAHSPILLLGSPGSGKSALLAQVADDLRGDGWFVLTVKADQIPAGIRSDSALVAWMGLSGDSPAGALSDLAEQQGRVAVLIDQLDALASLVDLHTARLFLLTRFLRAAAAVPGVRVVASIREFEASYDIQLRRLKSADAGIRPVAIKLSPLPAAEVAALWRDVVDPSYEGLPRPHLLEPQTLKLAVRLGRQLESAASVASEYWKLVREGQPPDAVQALFALVERMDREETLWARVDPADRALLASWVESGVLLELRDSEPDPPDADVRYGFAHQTLYDQVRAYRWLNANDPSSLSQWVRELYTTLSYRPKLLSILQRLRAERGRAHDQAWSELWALGAERPSLRELLAVHLAQADAPSDWEARRMRDLLANETWLRGPVVHVLAGREGWFRKLEPWLAAEIEADGGDWLAGYLRNAWRFAARTLDEWLAKWAVHPQRRQSALWTLMGRPRETWTDEGFRLLLGLAAAPGIDEDAVGMVASELEDHRLVALAVHYATQRWSRAATEAEEAPPPSDAWGTRPDPYAAPSHFPWERAAAADPVAFVVGLTPAVCRAASLALMPTMSDSSFARDWHAWRHVDRYSGEHPLPAFYAALRETVTRKDAVSATAQLAEVNNATLQGALVRAYQAHVEEAPAPLVDFLLADRRRFLLPEIGQALQALGPHVREADRARVLDVIATVERYTPAAPDSERAGRVADENERYRTMLARLLATGDPDDLEARDFVDDLSNPSRGGVVQSPHSAAELGVMDDDELDATLLYYAGREGAWREDSFHMDSPDPVGGNGELCRELEVWAKRQPERAAHLLERRLEDMARNTDASIDYRPAIAALLAGLSASAEAPAQGTAQLLDRALSAGLCEGSDEVAAEARWAIASQVVRKLVAHGVQLSDRVRAGIIGWARLDAKQEEPPTDPLEEQTSALGARGFAILPRGSFPALDALVHIALGGDDEDWSALLDVFEALVQAADAQSWRVLLSLPRRFYPVTLAHRERWVHWLDSLFDAHPGVLGHPDGVHVLWSQKWIAPPASMRRWIELLQRSEWSSGARVGIELATILACIGPHEQWATERLEATLSQPFDDVTALGLAHGIAFLLSDQHARSRAAPWALRFARHASTTHVGVMLHALRWRALQPGQALFDLVDTLRERGIPWPDDHMADLADTLLDGVEVDPLRALEAARWLVEQKGTRTTAHESLVVLALQITRQADDEPIRVRGMELFEAILKQGGWYARQAVQAMDGTRS